MDTTLSQSNRPTLERRLVVPQFQQFCEILQERLHATFDFHFELDGKFTLIVNLISRKNLTELQEKRMIYAGLNHQRKWLGEHFVSKNHTLKLNQAWNYLEEHGFLADKGIAGGPLFKQFEEGELEIEDIKIGTLAEYFGPKAEKGEFGNELQQREYPILKHYFTLEQDKYMSVPLIQFGIVDGLVHIVFDDKDEVSSTLKTNAAIKTMIKLFSEKYEGLLLDWDVVDANMDKRSYLEDDLRKLTSKEFEDKVKQNPIFEELKLNNYYRASEQYFKTRVQTTNLIPSLIIEQRRRNAIMSILIDSYAHNISAHSLTALTWLFRQRAEKIKALEKENKEVKEVKDSIGVSPLIYFSREFAGEIHPLFRFLLDKGAFWTGLTRERHFGGQILNMFDLLFDFANNPLYLGTIAFSEEILKVNIDVYIYEKIDFLENRLKRRKQLKKNKEGKLLYGNLIKIDLTQLYNLNQSTESEESNHSAETEELREFVTYGDAFKKLLPELSEYEVFLPGGVIGRHALFTILENEIRNVKHYDKTAIKNMRKDGLTICISIEETGLEEYDKERAAANYNQELYKVGIWLNHRVKLTQELILEKLSRLEKDIIDEENFYPRLGGSYQDKVCAALLFNNTFISVQNQESLRDKRFYPWVKSGSADIVDLVKEGKDYIEDYEISLRQMRWSKFKEAQDYFKANFKSHPGYLKKFVHLWQGKNIYRFRKSEKIDDQWENPSRFRFIQLDSKDVENIAAARDAGIIRIIQEDAPNLATAFEIWFKTWFNNQDNSRLTFRVEEQSGANIVYDENGIQFLNRDDFKELDKETRKKYQSYSEHEIRLAHGTQMELGPDKEICRFRTHGVLKQHFCNGLDLDDAEVSSEKAAEIYETLMSCVCIFDNRIANRVEKANQNMLQEKLNCFIYKEDTDQWNSLSQSGFDKFHFLVVHLSFIEAFRNDRGEKLYSERNVGAFIEKEIVGGKEIGDNFILVITTGRGRTLWWNRLENSNKYAQFLRFTTFRPVESIIAGIEHAISMKDDFELKYRLMKVLFGS